MARRHLYLAIEDIALGVVMRDALVVKMKMLGPASDPQPAHLNHWRISLDGSKAIFEANFREEVLTVDAMKMRLGNLFGVDPETINHRSITQKFVVRNTQIVTFSRNGTDYLRMAVFGGIAATWEQSRIETLGYLAANREEWEDVTEMAVSFSDQIAVTYRVGMGTVRRGISSLRSAVGGTLVRFGEWVQG